MTMIFVQGTLKRKLKLCVEDTYLVQSRTAQVLKSVVRQTSLDHHIAIYLKIYILVIIRFHFQAYLLPQPETKKPVATGAFQLYFPASDAICKLLIRFANVIEAR